MASPFKIFRKHQKFMLAVLGIMVMLSFVFGGVISDLLGARRSQNPVKVRTAKFGNLCVTDLSWLRQDRLKTNAILTKMLSKSFPPQVEMQVSQVTRQYVENIFGAAGEEAIVNSWLMAQMAGEMGMVISDDTINEFLQSLPLEFFRNYPQLSQFYAQNKLAPQDLAAIIRSEGFTENQFFNIMREELKAVFVKQMFSISLNGITPAQRWDYFCKLRKQASVELIPLEVENFVGQTKDPSEADLKELFEKYKDKLPRPELPEPGFRIPHRIDMQYVKADFAKFSDPKNITEDEIQDVYEKNRERYDKYAKELADLEKAAEENKTDEKKAEEKPAAEPVKDKPQEQPEAQPDAEKSSTDTPAAEQKPAEPPAAGEKSPEEDAKKSSSIERSLFKTVSMAEQGDQPAASQAPSEKPAADKSAAEKPAAEQPKADGAAAAPEAAQEKPERPKRTIPENIRKLIRAKIAQEKIVAVFDKIQQVMDESGKKWRKYDAEKLRKPNAVPPPKIDWEVINKGDFSIVQFAPVGGKMPPWQPLYPLLPKDQQTISIDGKEWRILSQERIENSDNRLTAHNTGMVSGPESHKFDIGDSSVDGVTSIANSAFKSMSTFKPYMSGDMQGNGYLFYIIDDSPESEPKLDDKDVRQQVVHAWKLNEARQLARKEAERLAEMARKTDQPLKQTFADNTELKVLAPPAFTFYTEGSVPRASSSTAVRLSQVEAAPMAGVDFMRAVFKLEPKQVGAAMNAPQTVAYVVQLDTYTPSEKVLWEIFLAENFSKYASLAVNDYRTEQREWMESLKTYAGLKWEVVPDQPHPESDADYMPEE
jgi:hypothetical protein